MNFSVMSRELFLLVIPFVEVVEYGFAPRRAEEVLVVLFVDRTVERVPLFAALSDRGVLPFEVRLRRVRGFPWVFSWVGEDWF